MSSQNMGRIYSCTKVCTNKCASTSHATQLQHIHTNKRVPLVGLQEASWWHTQTHLHHMRVLVQML